jgi:hypothetical protein
MKPQPRYQPGNLDEIEVKWYDTVDRDFLLEQLKNHHRNLQTLEKQRAIYAVGEEPLRLLNQIEAEKQEIAAIQAKLAKHGKPPDDEEKPSEPEQQSTEPTRTTFRVQLLQRGSSHMEVRGLAVSDGGTPKAKVKLPFVLADLKAILKALDLGKIIPGRFRTEYLQSLDRLGLLSGQRLRADFYQRVGQQLYQALFSGEILTEFKVAERAPGPIACQLCLDPEDVLLGQFPWELIHSGKMHLVPLKGGVELTRYITFQDPPPSLQTTLPLRALFISPRPTDDSELPDELEKNALLEGLNVLREQGQLVWRELESPTWAALEACLDSETFDIIHFDGHGSFARICPACGAAHYPSTKTCVNCGDDMSDAAPTGYLHFEDDDRYLDRVSVADMKSVLACSQTRLMVLTACQSGVAQGVSVFNGVAPGLIQVGVPAVVAMQGSSQVGTTCKFVERFYCSIAQGRCIPEAVNRGRLAIYRDKPVSWFMPVVYLRSADHTYGQLFKFNCRRL